MSRRSEPILVGHLNSVWLEGTLLADPDDLKGTAGSSGFRFQLQGGPSTFLVEAGPRSLDGCRERLHRGRLVRIIGRLHQHRWKDSSGEGHTEVKVIGELVETLGGPG
jgi:single-stranded DNA-binding protein